MYIKINHCYTHYQYCIDTKLVDVELFAWIAQMYMSLLLIHNANKMTIQWSIVAAFRKLIVKEALTKRLNQNQTS